MSVFSEYIPHRKFTSNTLNGVIFVKCLRFRFAILTSKLPASYVEGKQKGPVSC